MSDAFEGGPRDESVGEGINVPTDMLEQLATVRDLVAEQVPEASEWDIGDPDVALWLSLAAMRFRGETQINRIVGEDGRVELVVFEPVVDETGRPDLLVTAVSDGETLSDGLAGVLARAVAHETDFDGELAGLTSDGEQ